MASIDNQEINQNSTIDINNPYTEIEKKRQANTSIPGQRQKMKKNYLKLNMQQLSNNTLEHSIHQDSNNGGSIAKSIDFSERRQQRGSLNQNSSVRNNTNTYNQAHMFSEHNMRSTQTQGSIKDVDTIKKIRQWKQIA